MSASNREASISKTLTYEGGYTNDPRDPGGATNWGITIYDARKYWKHDASPADVKAMPKSVAIEIYRQKYWAKMGCDDRATGPDFVDFDYGVNSGTQRVFNLRKTLDPQKLSPVDYVKKACAARSSFLHSLKTWSVFGKGWGRRVADVEATGVRMALGSAGQPVAPALKKEVKAANVKAIAHSTAGASAPAAVPEVAHWDLGWLAGSALIVIGAAVVVYFVWNAVQANHRANAYQAQLSKA
ncbi:glycosyl hydrolase 108 family protein [Bradyrhizobium sp. BR 10289]|uniref:glycoside hydrolase family 108 protein n=1 Tax=Bradyrhizobium sp. BR 10289 TaxID=2749993 RepID=UPI001C6537E3|nr:glycosyl hydrolase 108 family protein [Bradyrhizobium sp. BR 10289]MBW7970960.1 secretion activator protein [Bradyrhizobium sp. BR 10289]